MGQTMRMTKIKARGRREAARALFRYELSQASRQERDAPEKTSKSSHPYSKKSDLSGSVRE